MFWFFRPLKREVGFYILAVVSSFLLFCLVVRFQPWQSRFHLPLFVLFCPAAGVVTGYFLNKKSVFLGALFFLAAIPCLFLNKQHPWLGDLSIWHQPKPAQYFYKRPYLALPYVETSGYLKSIGCDQIGLLTGEDTWEYPWWKFLARPGSRIEHVGVNNPSGALKYPLGAFEPCAVIVFGAEQKSLLMVGHGIYGPVGSLPAGDDKITIFLRKS